MAEVYELAKNMSLNLYYEAEDGWSCHLLRYFNEYKRDWITAVSVFDDEGREVMHSGYSECQITDYDAAECVDHARKLLESLGRNEL